MLSRTTKGCTCGCQGGCGFHLPTGDVASARALRHVTTCHSKHQLLGSPVPWPWSGLLPSLLEKCLSLDLRLKNMVSANVAPEEELMPLPCWPSLPPSSPLLDTHMHACTHGLFLFSYRLSMPSESQAPHWDLGLASCLCCSHILCFKETSDF